VNVEEEAALLERAALVLNKNWRVVL